ncbi:BTAD domain-containing putative transcriptional regulator [Geodermatophilus nigrescens]|uniref:Transcriptional regulatory protein, C terminal n=1 Tax=Geodermatophilus nigrescens TaxID=1070870 RepID=A0A1M5CRH3_9ACTN|nr:BTAD domain-containing putative transcriptional regulator [Geodermatophilus nigrescens]SHF57350.1 Transcriptional regulatory protein, C terminal [Geodermatophilus nigrescens]
MELRLDVLGPTRLARDGAELDLGGRRPAEVLALLAAAEGRTVPAGALADRLWRGAPPATATTTLQGHVSRLRRLVDPGRGARDAEVLVTRGDGYALVLPRTAVDAHAFADLVTAGTSGDDREAARLLPEALARWQDRPYADVADVDDVVPVVARLEELRRVAVERLAEARLALGGGAELVPGLTEAVAVSPLRERTAGLLARALVRAGRQADALDVLRRVRERIADELGLDPSAELRDLEAAVLRQDPALGARPAPARAPGAAPPPPAPAPPGPATDGFVGRPAELAALGAAWSAASAGRGTAVVVTGEPGIGKTRLVEAFAARAGAAVRWGRCAEIGGAPPYWPWQQVLGGLPEAALGSDTGARFALGLDTARRLHALGADAPLLVVLDDLQWADRDSLHVLEVVLSQLHDSRVLLAVTCREEATGDAALSRVLGAAARLPGARRLRLGGLAADEVADLVGELRGAPAEDAAALTARTGGNPFFVTELAALPAPSGPAVPAGVRDVVRLRVAALPAGAQRVLATAAVAGREVSLALLGAALGPGDPAGVTAALRTGLLLETTPGRVRVAHDLVREVLLADLGPVERAAVHGRLAAALEDGPAAATSAGAIAVHRSEAAAGGPDERAARACLRAAGEALDRAGVDEAVALAGRGLAHVPAGASALGADLHLLRGEGLRRLGLLEDSGAELRTAAGLARAADDPARLARAAVASAGGGVGGYWASVGAPAATDVALLEEAAARAGELPPALASAVLAALAVQRSSSGEPGGRELADRALAAAGDSPTARPRARVARFVADWTPAHAAGRVALARTMLRESTGDPAAEATALHLLRCALTETAQAEEAAVVSRRFTELATRRGDGDLLQLDAWWSAGLALARGDADGARRLADAAVADAPTTSPAAADVTRMSRQTIEGIAAWHERRMPDLVPEVVDLAATVDPGWLAVLAQAHAQAGRTGASRAAVERWLGFPAHGAREPVRTVLLADVALELRARDLAATVLPALRSYGDTVVVLWAGTTVLGPTALYRGGVLGLLGEPGAAAELERALELCDLFGFAPFVARARALLAEFC